MIALFLAAVLAAGHPGTHHVSVARTFQLPAGRAHTTFSFRVRANTPHLARLVVSRGAVVSVRARSDDDNMGLDISTRPWQRWGQGGWPQGCRHRGRRDVCVEYFEHCPLTYFSWHAAVRKTSAAPAKVHVRLVFWRR